MRDDGENARAARREQYQQQHHHELVCTPTKNDVHKVNPNLVPIQHAQFEFSTDSPVGDTISKIIQNFDIPLLKSNPAMLEMFRERDRQPLQSLLPWSGEFVGKYLTHCVQLARATQDTQLQSPLMSQIALVFKVLIQYQADNGYMGPFPTGYEFKTGAPNCAEPWDTWGHYHIMTAGILYYEEVNDAAVLQFIVRIADLLVKTFSGDPHKLYACGAYEQNQVIIHSLARLYSITQTQEYLDLCNTILEEWTIPPCGDYLNNALNNKPFYEGTQPRWEGLMGIMGLAELYWLTGNSQYSSAYQQIWWSLCQYERHNHGGIMSSEQASGSPYNTGSVETCCTITWAAMSVEMLKITGASVVADELELSLLNTGLLLESPSGRWCVYTSPMAGTKESTTMEISFQSRIAASELSCCSVNGPRIFGQICEWATMCVPEGSTMPRIVVNFFGAGTTTVPNLVSIEQETDYPLSGNVKMIITPLGSPDFQLQIRIPAWSERTTLSVNGTPVQGIIAGRYCALTRSWSKGDAIELTMDFRLRGWVYGTDFSNMETGNHGRDPSDPVVDDFVILTPNGLEVPDPIWDSTKDGGWPAAGKEFSGQPDELIVIDANSPAAGNSASTMMGWFCVERIFKDRILFSCGAGQKATPNLSRALALEGDQATYYLGGGSNDMLNIVDNTKPLDKAQMDQNWHHIAITDDGSTISLLLDGIPVGTRKIKDMDRNTAGGFMVGGWADRNRYYQGFLGGVQFFGSALTQADISAIMSSTKPSGRPKFPVSMSIYRGPLLLGYDPRFNTSDSAPPPLAMATISSYKQVPSTSWIEPLCLFEFQCADGSSINLCDCGSLGLSGRSFSTWLATDFKGEVPSSITFSKTNPTRTMFLETDGPVHCTI